MKESRIPIAGMHCRSCEIMIGDNLKQLPGVKKVHVSHKKESATIFADTMPSDELIAAAVKKAGYEVGSTKQPLFSKNPKDYRDVSISVIIVIIIAVVLAQLNLASINTTSLVSGGVLIALVVGITAGFSTCMALVGGLVLGLSAKHAEKHPDATALQKFRPHIYFNTSRIVTFFILGGAIGGIGAAFQLSGIMLGLLMIAVGIVMLLLGLQLTRLFPRLSTGGLTLPSGLSRRLGIDRREKEYSHKNAAILGSVSFFLPCGFTQAMQLYAISTGSFTTGALVMGLFAIGTAPGLLGVGGLASTIQGPAAKQFFKFAGVAVIAMALVNMSYGFNLTGWQRPEISADNKSEQTLDYTALTGEIEEAPAVNENAAANNKLKAQYTVASGMIPTSFTVKANKDYILEVHSLEDGVGCMSTVLIPGLNNQVQYLLKNQTNKLPFKATRAGTYQITCAMGVPHGTIKVI